MTVSQDRMSAQAAALGEGCILCITSRPRLSLISCDIMMVLWVQCSINSHSNKSSYTSRAMATVHPWSFLSAVLANLQNLSACVQVLDVETCNLQFQHKLSFASASLLSLQQPYAAATCSRNILSVSLQPTNMPIYCVLRRVRLWSVCTATVKCYKPGKFSY